MVWGAVVSHYTTNYLKMLVQVPEMVGIYRFYAFQRPFGHLNRGLFPSIVLLGILNLKFGGPFFLCGSQRGASLEHWGHINPSVTLRSC